MGKKINYNKKKHLIVMIIALILGVWFGHLASIGVSRPYGDKTEEVLIENPKIKERIKQEQIELKIGLPIVICGFINGMYFELIYIKKYKKILEKFLMFIICYPLFAYGGVIFLLPPVISDLKSLKKNNKIEQSNKEIKIIPKNKIILYLPLILIVLSFIINFFISMGFIKVNHLYSFIFLMFAIINGYIFSILWKAYKE